MKRRAGEGVSKRVHLNEGDKWSIRYRGVIQMRTLVPWNLGHRLHLAKLNQFKQTTELLLPSTYNKLRPEPKVLMDIVSSVPNPRLGSHLDENRWSEHLKELPIGKDWEWHSFPGLRLGSGWCRTDPLDDGYVSSSDKRASSGWAKGACS